MKTIVIASNNAHKAEEIATALAFPGWEFRTLRELGLDSDPAEDADSFEGNARIKAQAARAASGGLAVLADDSGLAVAPRASIPPAMPASRATTRRTTPSCLLNWPTYPTRSARVASCARSCSSTRTEPKRSRAAR